MEFKSQICTTIEQSKRLLGLGLKPETADCMYSVMTKSYNGYYIPENERQYNLCVFYQEEVQTVGFSQYEHIPAWSLYRLIELCPEYINIDGYADTTYWFKLYKIDNKIIYDNDYDRFIYLNDSDNLFDTLIYCIEWLINNKHFKQEYLNK